MEFVNFNIAELLFKLGFCEKCFGYYYQEPNTAVNNHKEDLVEYTCPYRGANYKDMLQNDLVFNSIDNIYPNIKIYNAPTISQALKWLREEKSIYVAPCVIGDCDTDADCRIINRFTFWSFDIQIIETADIIYSECESIIGGRFDSYEEAALAGIEYVLDNLI